MIDNLLESLRDHELVIVQDFSENYNSLLPDEPQSIHWIIQQATVYPVVTLRCHNKKIVEDYFVFISDDRTHDSSFVEYCADHIKEFYSANHPNITSFIELNDGCAQQFKSIKAISQLSRRPYYLSRLYFETSHGKSKSGGLGGVVKSFVSRSVNSEGTVVRNAMEFYQFCIENLTFRNRDGVVNNRCFILVKPEDLENSREQVAKCPDKTIPGTQKLHQLKIDIQCHLEYMLEIIYALAYPTEIRISKIVRQSLQILSGQVLKRFASIGSLTSVKRVMKSQILIVTPPWMMMT